MDSTHNLLASECPRVSSNLQIHAVPTAKHNPVVSSANLKFVGPRLPLDLLSVLPDDLLHNSNIAPTLAVLAAIASGSRFLYQCPVSQR